MHLNQKPAPYFVSTNRVEGRWGQKGLLGEIPVAPSCKIIALLKSLNLCWRSDPLCFKVEGTLLLIRGNFSPVLASDLILYNSSVFRQGLQAGCAWILAGLAWFSALSIPNYLAVLVFQDSRLARSRSRSSGSGNACREPSSRFLKWYLFPF